MSKQRAAAQQAARHHTTLAAFEAVVAVLEGGIVYDPQAYKAKEKIIALCHAEQQRQLARFDREMAKLVTTDAA